MTKPAKNRPTVIGVDVFAARIGRSRRWAYEAINQRLVDAVWVDGNRIGGVWEDQVERHKDSPPKTRTREIPA